MLSPEEFVFPEYEFTFEVVSIHFQIAQFNVLYKPTHPNLTNIELSLPILPSMDLNDLLPYVKKFAPYQQWYAQTIILEHSDSLLGAKG